MRHEPKLSVSTPFAEALDGHRAAMDGFFAAESGALEELCARIVTCFKRGNKLLLCGNGGSTCDAMHIAGEFVGRFQRERAGLPAIALSADSGILTAVANDYGFERVFSRQVEALGQKGDLLIALSTSGKSPNILAAIETAKQKGLTTVLFTGEKGRGNSAGAEMVLAVPATDTARIQEVHITALHILSDTVEAALTGAGV